MEWHIAYSKIKPYLVRINTENGFGTGFLFAFNKDHSLAAIATAAHIVEHSNNWRKPLKIGHYDSRKIEFYNEDNRVIWLDINRDAATILVVASSLPFPSATLPMMDHTKYKSIGVEMGWVGFPSLVPDELCFFSGKISCWLDDEECYLIDGVAINGVSGGPVFDQLEDSTPEVVGVVSAYVPNRLQVDTLPGLLRAQDIAPFYKHIQNLKSLDEAKEKEIETQKEIDREEQQDSE